MPTRPLALALAANGTRLSSPDLAIVALYLVAITLFGLRFRDKKTAHGPSNQARSLKSYFLANNTIPWWAIALSIVSAETSTLTIISVPGIAFAGNFGFLQLVIGYMLGRIVVAVLFLPKYFAGEMLTAYQLIDRRFGPVLHKVTAGLFLLTRAAAEGVRVFAVSIVVGIAIGTRDVLSIAIISALTLLYTFEGGMTAVIWTDVVQMVLYVGGTVVAILTLGTHVPGGWGHIAQVASAAGKFHLFDFTLNLTTTYTFWAGVLGGTFLTMASHGTDQLMVQRMLAARNLRESRLALLSSGVVIFIQFTLFLLIGAGLYVFYGAATPGATPGAPSVAGLHPATGGLATISALSPDRIFPTFIVREMPIGIAGLLVAAILAAAMSNLSAALNSLSSTTVVDFYMRLRTSADHRERSLISKSSTVLWALVLFAIAVYSVGVGGKGHVVEIGLSIASVAYGCLLGVFLLGTLTKYATELGATIGMVCGFALNLWLWQGTFPKVLWQTGYNTARSGPNGQIFHDVLFPGLSIPHIAYPWYTLIGAIVTFAIGTLFSLIFRKQSKRTITGTATAALLLFCLSFPKGICVSAAAQTPGAPSVARHATGGKPQSPDFSPITMLITDAIAARKLPGAVAVIGHNGHVVFRHAYGNRKLAGEPGLDGKPSEAEPMTEDTIFDMASLTKCLATATAIMQLYEAGKIKSFDDPIATYLPDFLSAPTTLSAEGATTSQPGPKAQVSPRTEARVEGPAHSATTTARTRVTLRMLLTHTSGEPPDISLKDPWGLAAPDRNEGLHRALTAPLTGTPGTKFVYSDVNYILLGALIEKLSGQREDVYVADHIYLPLGMAETRYLPLDKVCGPHRVVGSAIVWAPNFAARINLDHTMTTTISDYACPRILWGTGLLERIAPTTHDDEGKTDPATNPHYDMLTRGTVHDPTTRRMGGVAGHAGVFSTANDVALFAQALLDKLRNNTGPFPLKQSTLQLMTQPEQPTTNPGAPSVALHATGGMHNAQLAAANAATQASIAAADKPAEPGLAPHYPAIPNHNLRGFGWDIDTAFSKPRGAIFPIGSFGHTGFTGTSLWMDPASNTYVILLANAIHPRGNPPISALRGQVATAAAEALGLSHDNASRYPESSASGLPPGQEKNGLQPLGYALSNSGKTLTGIDILESTGFAALKAVAAHHDNHLRFALLTNQSGIDAEGHRTIDILHAPAASDLHLAALFSPEHGIAGKFDSTTIAAETDPATGLHVTSLYGAKDADRRPTHAQLKNLDAVVIDLQDAGVRFWTYESVLGYFLEASAAEERTFHHRLDIVVLDRPSLVGGLAVQGPVSDSGPPLAQASYVNYMPIPVRHGMTFGELARYINQNKLDPTTGTKLDAPLTIVRLSHWTRDQFFDSTGLPWINPSPNLRSATAALLYPALGLIETTNLSVGRGTNDPFSFFGAGTTPSGTASHAGTPAAGLWFDSVTVAGYLTGRHIPGVTFTATTRAIAEDANRYPYHGQTIPAVGVSLTDAALADTPELGIEILSALHHLYPAQFALDKALTLLCSRSTLEALRRDDDPRSIAASWQPALERFKADRQKVLLY